jgi:hypothetical protein
MEGKKKGEKNMEGEEGKIKNGVEEEEGTT